MVLVTAAVVAALAAPVAVPPARPLSLELSFPNPVAKRPLSLQATLSTPVVLDWFPRVELKIGKFIMKSFGVGANYHLFPWVALGASSNVVKPGPGQPLALQLVGLLQFRF